MSDDRRQAALAYRIEAANTAFNRDHPKHKANGDEERYASAHYAMSFTKGLRHDEETGLLTVADDFRIFREAIDMGFIDPFTAEVPVPRMTVVEGDRTTERRVWEAPTAGVVFELEGPDPQAVTMAPAPSLSDHESRAELAYEMAEVYELAIVRDCHFGAFQTKAVPGLKLDKEHVKSVQDGLDRLNGTRYAQCHYPGRPRKTEHHPKPDEPNDVEKNPCHPIEITRQEAYRGSSPGVEVGPYLSQFMLIGNSDRGDPAIGVADGYIQYGALVIDQRVSTAVVGQDYMKDKKCWLHVQNGFQPLEGARGSADKAKAEFETTRRFITTPRDLATYVHFDALYEAYLNATLILLGMGAPLDPAFGALSGELPLGTQSACCNPGFEKETLKEPSSRATLLRTAGGFALYGGPHVLTLVTEVATRALKAVRFQKFNNHIRLRPETLAGRIACREDIHAHFPAFAHDLHKLEKMIEETVAAVQKACGTTFLPMAFPEGSPMHPAYGAGHATVAGACVTMVKAFFDTDAAFVERTATDGTVSTGFMRYQHGDKAIAYVPDANGTKLIKCDLDKPLTLEGELNKLAANISIGRNMAGVHYFTDYYDSVRMGEEIAIGILEEQALGYKLDPFVMSVPTFDGDVVRIGRR